MSDLLTLQIPLFVLVAVGFLVKRVGIVDHGSQKALNNLVMNVVLPCNIFNSFLMKISAETARDCVAVIIISIAIQVFSVIYAKIVFRKEPDGRQRCLTYGTLCSNAGFLGNPIAEGLYGAPGLMLASIFLIPMRVMMWSEGIAVFSGISDKKMAMKKVLTHPCVIACEAGLIFMLGHIPFPELLQSPLQAISRCNTALSMMVIGMIVAEIDLKTFFDKTVILYTLHRLIIIPAIVYLALLPFPVSRMVRALSTILIAMPAGATTSILASQYDMEVDFATKMVIFSTVCSLPTIFIWSILLV